MAITFYFALASIVIFICRLLCRKDKELGENLGATGIIILVIVLIGDIISTYNKFETVVYENNSTKPARVRVMASRIFMKDHVKEFTVMPNSYISVYNAKLISATEIDDILFDNI